MFNDNIRNKIYYMVKNITDQADTVVIASGVIGADTYSICKVDTEAASPVPTGDTVVQYADADEVRAALGLTIFNGGIMGQGILDKELEFCNFISERLRAANSGLSIAAGDALFTELEATSHAVSRGLVNIAWSRFNATDDLIVDPATKASFNLLFDEFFAKYPRDLS